MINKKISIVLIIMLILGAITPIYGESFTKVQKPTSPDSHKEILTEQEIDRIIKDGDFEGFEVKKEITEIEGFTVNTITIKQSIEQRDSFNNYNSSNEMTPNAIIYVKREISSSKQDGSITATIFATAIFDVWNRSGVNYVRMDEVRFKTTIHDGTFRTKEMGAIAGQGSWQAVDRYGNPVYPSAEQKNYFVSYPTSGVEYGGLTGFTKYFNSNTNADLNARLDVIIERTSTGSTFTINTKVSYFND